MDIAVGLGPDGDWMYPFSPAVRGEGAQWLMFFAQAGAPNYYDPAYRYYGYPGERRSYEEHPGVGEYMCFDPLMQADLEEYARKMGREDWYAARHLTSRSLNKFITTCGYRRRSKVHC